MIFFLFATIFYTSLLKRNIKMLKNKIYLLFKQKIKKYK